MRRFKKENFRLFLKFSRYLLPYWKKELLVIILGQLVVVFGLANPFLSKLLIDRGILGKDLNFFILIALAMAGLFILTGVVNAIVRYLSVYINNKIELDLNRNVFRHLNRLSFSFFQSKTSGEHIYKINYDIDRIADFVTMAISEIVTMLPRTLFIFLIIYYLDRRMAILGLCLAPFLYISPYFFSKKLKVVYKELFQRSQEIFDRLTEVFSHIHLVKALGKEVREFKDYIRRLTANIDLSLKTTKIATLSSFSSNVVSRLIAGLIFFYGGYQVIAGRISFGSVTAIMLYINQMFGLQNKFAAFFQRAAEGMVSCERIEEVFRQIPHEGTDGTRSVRFDKSEIVFDNVSFRYDNKKPVLENINFKIGARSHIALVGPSGCGKTTIINLILRLYEPKTGRILIDGNSLKEIKSDSIYGQISIALQEPFLWNDTVENNIRYGKEDALFNQIVDVSRLVGIDDFVRTLPKGYKTKIGENATLISQGQKQRIAIARAIIKNPAIIILDEAMSSLDSESEEKIIDNLKARFKSSTIIVVSHRLSTVKKIDKVYFLEREDKIIIGYHEQLVRQNSGYRELFASQIEEENSVRA